LSKVDLGSAKRRAPFLTEAFRDLVHRLCDARVGVSELRLGHKHLQGVRSTVRAGEWLRERIDDLGLSLGDIGRRKDLLGDSLVMRSDKVNGEARNLPLPDSEFVTKLRTEMSELNSWLAKADLEYLTAEDDRVDLGQRYLRRIFNQGSLDKGGRLYGGFWQDLSREKRSMLLIDGQPIASVDFAQMSVRLSYAQVGAPIPTDGVDDLYSVVGLGGSRDGVKLVMNALLAADKIPQRMPQGTREYFPARVKIADIIEAISRRHPALAQLFGSAQSGTHQHIESRVILRVMARLRDLGVVALPVHDCVLVPWSNAALAKAVMEQMFEEETGGKGLAEVELSPMAHSQSSKPSGSQAST